MYFQVRWPHRGHVKLFLTMDKKSRRYSAPNKGCIHNIYAPLPTFARRSLLLFAWLLYVPALFLDGRPASNAKSKNRGLRDLIDEGRNW
jgi:hypothetical protein